MGFVCTCMLCVCLVGSSSGSLLLLLLLLLWLLRLLLLLWLLRRLAAWLQPLDAGDGSVAVGLCHIVGRLSLRVLER